MATKDKEWLIDDLAREAETKVSTVRLYHQRGLLPGPDVRGRTGYYGAGHLARLSLIKRMQERGFSLAAIKSLVDSWEDGGSLSSVFDTDESKSSIQATELAKLMSAIPSPKEMERAIKLGAFKIEGTKVVFAAPVVLEIIRELGPKNVPLAKLVDQSELVARMCRDIADNFVDIFETYIWKPFVEAGMSTEQLPDLVALLTRLRSLGVDVVAANMRKAIGEAANEALERHADELKGAGISIQDQLRKTGT